MRIFDWLFYAGYKKEVYQETREHLILGNKQRLTYFSLFFSAMLFVLTAASFIVSVGTSLRWTYPVFLGVVLLILALEYFVGRRYDAVVFPLIYLFIVVALLLGIFVSVVQSPNEISATYIALLLTVPQIIVDKPYRIHLVTLVMTVIFIVTVLLVKDPSTWHSDSVNAVVFYVVSAFLTTFNTYTRISRYLMENKIRTMAEQDQLTGLLNRNSYQLALEEAEKKADPRFYTVYLDANGLHDLNNRDGHEAGDRMISEIGALMSDAFGKNDTFRIGGDEFVAIGTGLSAEEIEKKIAALRVKIHSAGYSAAIGFCVTSDPYASVGEVVRKAETNMFADKKAYYESEGKTPQRMH